ncbi:MAG TPA: hypothetical protein VNY29_13970 [Terriglobales bacterium]|jgi:hypothetical protein|nr:hypothetical protein [Terriglobales bacterium]
MINRIRRRLRDPRFLVSLAACLIAFVVQSGDLDSADTARRLQTTHSFWTSAPPVLPGDYPDFGLRGRGGRIYAWYGVGQSLLMLPADVVGTALERLPAFQDYNGNDPSVRAIVVSYSTNMLVNVLTALVGLRFLLLLGFSMPEAAAGVLALLACTSHLHYTQNMMENNYILLLTLAGFSFQYEWLKTGSQRELWIGSAALGLNLLTRLTTGMDLIAAGIFLLLVLWFETARADAIWQKALIYVRTAVPIYLFFLLIDRLYQFWRFGSFLNTYVSLFAAEQRQLRPELPASFPFETPFHIGFFGALFTPEKSIFLFDPLLVLTILLAVLLWKRLSPELRAYLVSAFLLLLIYVSFYARYTVWSGDSAWGDRYVSTAVDLAVFISVPLLLRYRAGLRKFVHTAGLAIVAASAAIQAASVAFWLELELYQIMTRNHPTFVVALRFENIVAFAFGKMNQWGLTNSAMADDAWDYVHITTWNFFPFVLRRVGAAPGWVVGIAFAAWGAGLLLLGWVLWRLRGALRSGGANEAPESAPHAE